MPRVPWGSLPGCSPPQAPARERVRPPGVLSTQGARCSRRPSIKRTASDGIRIGSHFAGGPLVTRRFPFPHPFGWFMVAYADELAPGEVTALTYWSTELVLWCDETGEFHLQDA